MSLLQMGGRMWWSGLFNDEVVDMGPVPPTKTLVTELTFIGGKRETYRQPDDIGPNPNIYGGFIEVEEGRFISTRDIAEIKVWKER